MVDFTQKQRYTVYDLVEIVRLLRSENGCPWDKVQTHKSVRMDFLEEVYEVLDAIDADNPEMLCEELGDVMLQVVFHTQMEREKNTFEFDDVADGICKKLVERHPHVFGDLKIEDKDKVLENWDKIKRDKKQQNYSESMANVPVTLPSLMRAQKLFRRAGRAGVETEVRDSLKNELNSSDNKNKIIGNLLFEIAALAKENGIDAEEALQFANQRFIDGVAKLEADNRLDGIDKKSLSIDKL